MRKKDKPIFTHWQNRKILAGFLLPDGTFWKKTYSRQRYFRENCYGLDAQIIEQLKQHNCKAIKITEHDTGKTFHIDFDAFTRQAQIRESKFGPRYYLSLQFWQEISPDSGQLSLFPGEVAS